MKDTLKIEWWPIDRPKPYAKNARKIPQKAIDLVAKSLREFGWQQAIVCDAADVIIAGHTRLLAATQEGMTHVPVSVAAHLTPAQVRAYRLMDNRSHEESSWDLDIWELYTCLHSPSLHKSFIGPRFVLDYIDVAMYY